MHTKHDKRAEKEQQLIAQVKKNFRAQTGFTLEFQTPGYGLEHYDYVLHLYKDGVYPQKFPVKIKLNVNNQNIGAVIAQIIQFDEMPVLVTRYVNPRIAENLKERGIAFIDTVGNAFIDCPPLYIYITGKIPEDELKRTPVGRAFTTAGLQVIYALLCHPGIENEPMRHIARKTKVALGTVATVINELKNLGYLIDMKRRGRRLVNKNKLLERWLVRYPEILRPKLLIGRYTAKDPNWWKHLDIEDFKAHWGGEVAAEKLTGYLRPEIITIYLKEHRGKLLLKNKLKHDPDGEIELLQQFWVNDYNDELTHPILIYTDLLATAHGRNIETANLIYEKYIAGFLNED